MGSTANLDTGYRHPNWHNHCASVFFVFTILASFYNTFINGVLYYKAKIISKSKAYGKFFILFLTALQLYLSSKYGESALIYKTNDYGNDIGHIIEYTASFTILFYIYLIGIDVEKYKLDYELA